MKLKALPRLENGLDIVISTKKNKAVEANMLDNSFHVDSIGRESYSYLSGCLCTGSFNVY